MKTCLPGLLNGSFGMNLELFGLALMSFLEIWLAFLAHRDMRADTDMSKLSDSRFAELEPWPCDAQAMV